MINEIAADRSVKDSFWSRRKTFRTSSENTYRFAILLGLKDVAKEIQKYN